MAGIAPSVAARRPLGTAQEVADFLGVPLQTIYTWRTRNQGPRGIKVGRHLRFRWSDVERFLDENAAA